MGYLWTLVIVLMASNAFGAASIVPAFGKLSSAGMSIDAAKQGTNTLQIVGATLSKPGGKPTLTIPTVVIPTAADELNAAGSVTTPSDSSFFGFLDSVYKKVQWSNIKSIIRGGVAVDTDYASLAIAIANIGSSQKTLKVTQSQTVVANLNIPANIELVFENGAVINHSTYTIAYAGNTSKWPTSQIFNGSAAVTLTNTQAALPEWFGVNGTDDTLAVQKALNAAKVVKFSKVYVTGNLTSPIGLIEVYGNGVGTGLRSKGGISGALFTTGAQAVNFHDFEMIGTSDSDQKGIVPVTSPNVNGLEVYVMYPSMFNHLSIHGFPSYGLKGVDTVTDSAPYRRARASFNQIVLYNNGAGFYPGVAGNGEYVKISNVDVSHNYYGFVIDAGNVTISNSKINDNGVNVWVENGGGNDGHGNINGCLINHGGVYSVRVSGLTNGFNFIGNNIIDGDILIENSRGVSISNGIIDVAGIYLTSSTGFNVIENNRILGSAANVVTRTSDTYSVVRENHNIAVTATQNLLNSWSNNVTYPYGTFSATGANINSAISASGTALMAANLTALTPGKVYELTLNITLKGVGWPPFICSGTGAGSTNGSIPFQRLMPGKNVITFTAVANDVVISLENLEATTFTATASLKEASYGLVQ